MFCHQLYMMLNNWNIITVDSHLWGCIENMWAMYFNNLVHELTVYCLKHWDLGIVSKGSHEKDPVKYWPVWMLDIEGTSTSVYTHFSSLVYNGCCYLTIYRGKRKQICSVWNSKMDKKLLLHTSSTWSFLNSCWS